MHTIAPISQLERTRTLFSTLWIFVMFNYLYADVMGLMDSSLLRQYLTGQVDSVSITPGFLLAAGVLMEVPIAMTLLSRVLPYRANRLANIAAGMLKTAAVAASLFVGTPTVYYVFFATIEIACTVGIVVVAWRWRDHGPLAEAA
jgi:hypothetical protein